MRRSVNSAALRRAADANDRRTDELNKLGDSDESVRVADDAARAARNERELQALRVDLADREVEHHLDGVLPPSPPPADSGDGNVRRPLAGSAVADIPLDRSPRYVFPNTATAWVIGIIAMLALVIAVIALFFPKSEAGVTLGAVRSEIAAALQPVKAELGTVKSAGETNARDIKTWGDRQAAFEKNTNDALAKKCDCEKKPASKPAGGAKPASKPATTPAAGGGKIVRPSHVWGFFQYDSSATNPKTCYFTAEVTKKASRCSAYEIVEAMKGESESEWTARIALKVLHMKAFETEHIGKMPVR